MVGMVMIRAGYNNWGNGLGHTCQGPGDDNFVQPYLCTTVIAMELVFMKYLGNNIGRIDKCDDHDGKMKGGMK